MGTNGFRVVAENQSKLDPEGWAERCQYWLDQHIISKRPGRPARHIHEPLVLTGHGLRLRVDHGALVVRDGLIRYPQAVREWRFFPGDRTKPSRIVILDGSGSLTLDVLSWLSDQDIPLIRIDWRGQVITAVGRSGQLNIERVAEQWETLTRRSMPAATGLIRQKLNNSIETLQMLPVSPARKEAIEKHREALNRLKQQPPRTKRELLAVEGSAGMFYFNAWRGIPLRWKGTGRHPIPDDWRQIGFRTGRTTKHTSNRHATHPINAMRNYVYAVLEGQTRLNICVAGYDPSIGIFHSRQRDRNALMLDMMEPLRPIVDRVILELAQSHTFDPADFTLTKEGVCRLNPEMARQIVFRTLNGING